MLPVPPPQLPHESQALPPRRVRTKGRSTSVHSA